MTAIGVFTLCAVMQASSVYSLITTSASTPVPQSMTTAQWSVLPVESNTSTLLVSTFISINGANDPGRGSYLSIRNLGDVPVTGMNLTAVNSRAIGNGAVSVEWCPSGPWNESAGTCNGSASGSLLLTADKRTAATLIWNQPLAVNGSIRLRLQRSTGTGRNADTTITVEVPRTFVRPGIQSQN